MWHCAIDYFDMTISLWMESNALVQLGVHKFLQSWPKFPNKTWILMRYNGSGKPKMNPYKFKVQLSSLLDFLKIWLDYLGSLYERITSTTKCIRYKRYTRHKDFHRGNNKGEITANFFKIVRWSIAVIRNVQQLSFFSPLSVSLAHAP